MEILHTELFPQIDLCLGLFTEVQNSPELKEKLKDLNCSFINPRLLCDLDHLIIAITRALFTKEFSKSKTGNFFLDVVYYLSGTGNIRDTLKKFGISEENQEIIVFCTRLEDYQSVKNLIRGNEKSIQGLGELTNMQELVKEFHLSPGEKSSLSNSLVSIHNRIAIKDL